MVTRDRSKLEKKEWKGIEYETDLDIPGVEGEATLVCLTHESRRKG